MHQPIILSQASYNNCKVLSDSERAVVEFHEDSGRLIFTGKPGFVGNVDWSKAKFLVMDVKNLEDCSEEVIFELWDKNNKENSPDSAITTNILPGIRARFVFRLEYLNSNMFILPLSPGSLKAVVNGNKLDILDVDRIALGLRGGLKDSKKVEISNLHVTDIQPEYLMPDSKNVDELGQWTAKSWRGKTDDICQLTDFLKAEYGSSADHAFPEDRSRYGGLKKKKLDGEGYFRTHNDGKRWWLVDPDGYAFYSTGVFGVYPGEFGWVHGKEGFFEWLPERYGEYRDAWKASREDELFMRKYRDIVDPNIGMFSFAIANLIRAFGSDWWTNWASITRKRLVNYGINTLSMGTPINVARCLEMPYTMMLSNFPTTQKKIFRDFPDVFSDEYRNNAASFAKQLKAFEGDKFLLGYFLNNEPNWCFVSGLNIAEELLEHKDEFASKHHLIAYLSDRYNGDIRELNGSWNTSFACFEELNGGIKKAASFSEASATDLRNFSRIMTESYVKIPSEAVKTVDPHHLNLGMRYAGVHDTNLLAGCDNFDIFSLNYYDSNPVDHAEAISKAIHMPMMIGEFHFGALDRGLPSTGLKGVASQEERGKAYRYYMENFADFKYSVGAHYFMYNDQPLWGRYDGENYQIGFVDVCNKPYYEFVDEVSSTNSTIYDVVGGGKEKYDIAPKLII